MLEHFSKKLLKPSLIQQKEIWAARYCRKRTGSLKYLLFQAWLVGWAARGLLLCAEGLPRCKVQDRILLCPYALLAPGAGCTRCPARPAGGEMGQELAWDVCWFLFPDIDDSIPWSTGLQVPPPPSWLCWDCQGEEIPAQRCPLSQGIGSGLGDGAGGADALPRGLLQSGRSTEIQTQHNLAQKMGGFFSPLFFFLFVTD